MRSLASLACLVVACGGTSKGAPDGAVPDVPAQDAGADALTTADRQAAAEMTASTNPLCTSIVPFYWEIGDISGALGSGAEGTSPPDGTTVMAIASASKWLFGAYAIEKLGGTLGPSDIAFMNFTSGYVGFTSEQPCMAMGTVDDCLAGARGEQTASAIGMFDYNGAHLQEYAHVLGDGAMNDAALATEVRSMIGTDIDISYSQPQPAGGVYTSAAQYALFLRKLLVSSPTPLVMGAMLVVDPVCTNPQTCPTALSSPIPRPGANESWHYGLAHWIEDDPVVGDGAASSAGSFGFYPWVDATRTYYGILARRSQDGGEGYDSAACGRLIRKAWITGAAVTQ